MNLWPHQERGLAEIDAAIERGERRLCVTSPTGGGKTKMMEQRVQLAKERGHKIVLYTNRKLLIQQTSDVLAAAGHNHGVRADGYQDEREFDVQISSIQTEHSRVMKRGTWSNLHQAEEVIVDECHLQTGPSARQILDAHYEEGASILGFTATPIDLADVYETLIVSGTNSQLRECGALVPAYHYGPDEPDLKKIRKVTLGEDLSENQVRSVMGAVDAEGNANVQLQCLVGRVLDWRHKINPDSRPEIVFWCGVPESLNGAIEFEASGIKSAHIDGNNVWVDGELHRSSAAVRKQVLADSKSGRIKTLHNRFVLREGIDCPWLVNGIFATVFGSLQTFLQSGGRLLRAFEGVENVTIQDHGGNWWRHGSLNADRVWRLDQTNNMIAGVRADQFRQKDGPGEPVRCPKCSRILHGWKCPCGFAITPGYRVRPVIQESGALKMHEGQVFKPRFVKYKDDTFEKWKQCYYRCRNSGRSFAQAEGLFVHENGYWPPRTLPMMPLDPEDWYRKVNRVPREGLR